MVETITPVVHGGRAKWVRGVAVHVAAATGTAAALGALLGAFGAGVGAPWGGEGLWALAAAAAWYAASEQRLLVAPIPQLRRQVPDWWRTYYGPTVTAGLYGAG